MKLLWLQSLVVQPLPSRNFSWLQSFILFFFSFAFRRECNWFTALNKHCTYMPNVIHWMWILGVSCSANTLSMNKYIHFFLSKVLLKHFCFMAMAICGDSACHAELQISIWAAVNTCRKYFARAGWSLWGLKIRFAFATQSLAGFNLSCYSEGFCNPAWTLL